MVFCLLSCHLELLGSRVFGCEDQRLSAVKFTEEFSGICGRSRKDEELGLAEGRLQALTEDHCSDRWTRSNEPEDVPLPYNLSLASPSSSSQDLLSNAVQYIPWQPPNQQLT